MWLVGMQENNRQVVYAAPPGNREFTRTWQNPAGEWPYLKSIHIYKEWWWQGGMLDPRSMRHSTHGHHGAKKESFDIIVFIVMCQSQRLGSFSSVKQRAMQGTGPLSLVVQGRVSELLKHWLDMVWRRSQG